MSCSIILNPATKLYHWATILSTGEWFISSQGYTSYDSAKETAETIYNHKVIN